MSVTPTRLTAALAGIFSGLTWPVVWPFASGTDTSATLWLLLATIGLVGLPAHAFVLGFRRNETTPSHSVDLALLSRIGVWVAGGVLTALGVAAYRASA